MTENHFKYWAFVSYSPADNCESRPDAPGVGHWRWGRWLLDTLNNFATPADFAGHINARGEIVPERIDPLFTPEQEVVAGASLSADVRAALEQSRYLIVICSPRSAKSRAVDEAVRQFKLLGRGNRILSVVIAGEPHTQIASQPGLWLDDECFSPALRHPVLPDGTLDTNRLERGYIFADARLGEDKREILAKDFPTAEAELERAKIQLIAGLIGVGFNGLWQRESRRRFAGFAEAQNQISEAWSQAHQAQQKLGEIQKRVQELEIETHAAQGKLLEVQLQLADARQQVRDVQKKNLEMQNLPLDAKRQIQEAQDQVTAAEQQIQELKNQAREAERQLEQARNQAREAGAKLSDAQNQTRETQGQAEAARSQAHEIQAKTRDAQNQIEAAQKKIRDAEEQARIARSDVEATRQQARDAQDQLQATQDKVRTAQRLTKVFAVLAVLAAIAAGVVWSQRKATSSELANTSTAPVPVAATNQLDAEQIRQALQNANGAGQTNNLDELAAKIPPEKFSETLNLAATILDDPQRRHFQAQLLDSWVKTDAAAAFDWSRQLTNVASRQFALEKIIPALATDTSTHALAAFNWLQSQTNAETIPAVVWRRTMLASFFKNWAAKDLAAAANAAEAVSAGAAKDTVREIILRQRIASAPAAAADAITNLPPGDFRQQAIAELCQHWTDAPTALAWAQTLPGENESSNAVGQIIGGWAKYDFSAATNGIAGLPAGGKKLSAQLALAEPWAQKDANALAMNALALPAGEVQTRWLTAACRQLAANDFAAVAGLLPPLSAAALRQNLLAQAARVSGLPHLDATAKWIAAMPAGDDQQAAIKGLLPVWPDAESALNWLCAFPETNSQPPPIQSTLKTWAQSEPSAAAKWLANVLPAASEETTGAFLDGAVVKYPEFAAQWTQSVTNDIQREKFQEQIARRWVKTDPTAAAKWIDALNVPEATKQALKAQ